VVVNVHCHNDLGMAVANSLAAVKKGARQIECTINGLGERAGNTALEEVVMSLKTRKDWFGKVHTDIVTEEIYKTSKLVSNLTGMKVQRNKAVVGENAFAHEAGIHQDGVLKETSTYEIMTPASIGLKTNVLVLGKHSGRHAFFNKLEQMGYTLSEEDKERAFLRFKALADKKKNIFDEDIAAIVEDEIFVAPSKYTLKSFHITSGTNIVPTATVAIESEGSVVQDAACGDGPVDAASKAIDRITGFSPKLIDYSIQAVTEGKDAIGEVMIKLKLNDHLVVGRSARTDIVEASILAYLNAVNKAVFRNEKSVERVRKIEFSDRDE